MEAVYFVLAVAAMAADHAKPSRGLAGRAALRITWLARFQLPKRRGIGFRVRDRANIIVIIQVQVCVKPWVLYDSGSACQILHR